MEHAIVLFEIVLFVISTYTLIEGGVYVSNKIKAHTDKKIVENIWHVHCKSHTIYSTKPLRFNNVYYSVDIQKSFFEDDNEN
jgi:hypothetical protein